MEVSHKKAFAKAEISEVLEKYGFIEIKPKFLYEFGEEGPTDSQLESAEQDFNDRIIEHDKQINEALIELFNPPLK